MVVGLYRSLLFSLLAVLTFAPAASSTTIVFGQCVTDNNAGDCAIAFDQISLDVTKKQNDKVEFDKTAGEKGPKAEVVRLVQ